MTLGTEPEPAPSSRAVQEQGQVAFHSLFASRWKQPVLPLFGTGGLGDPFARDKMLGNAEEFEQ